MDASARWINEYLDRPATIDEIADALTMAGFPIEGREDLDDGDTRLDVELTSNRGDCLCHVGLAREVAAVTGRMLKAPSPNNKTSGPQASTKTKVTNHDHERCPIYTARIMHGVKVGPSPAWLADRLRAIGQIPRNNVVDATNFVLFELGQPTHVFDLAKLKGPEIIIRRAKKDEPFLPLGEGEKEIKLTEEDLVIADAERAVAIGGVKGGANSSVTSATTDILIEAATFQPAAVRRSAQRHRIDSASAYRFERGVDPRFVNGAAERLVELLLEVAGGTLCEGVVSDGRAIPADPSITMRLSRCRQLLGYDASDDEVLNALDRLSLQPKREGDVVRCTVPAHRLDLEREVDLIEEVARVLGLNRVPIMESIPVRIAPLQPSVRNRRSVAEFLAGSGYLETVTHSLVSEKAATLFLPPGLDLLAVSDERAKAEPILRPSILPSLLRVLAHNRANGVTDAKLFETASTFAQMKGDHVERVNLAILHPADDADRGARELRGIIDRLARLVIGPETALTVEPTDQLSWFAPGAALRLDGEVLGTFGALSSDVLKQFDLEGPLLAAEIGLPAQYAREAPDRAVQPLPAFPSIERDLSAVVDERTRWIDLERTVRALNLAMLEAITFVTTYRGKQIGEGRKSVTLRLRFRAADRTLTHDEVDPQMEQAMHAITQALGGEIRR